MKKFVSIFLISAAALLLHGCGYTLAVKNSAIPVDRSLSVAMFANRTYQPNIDSELRQSLVSALVSRGGRIGGELSDYILSGEILSLTTEASAFSAHDNVMYYTVVMTVQATLTERRGGKVIWKGGEIIRQGYPANHDLALQRTAHDAAVSAVCNSVAQILAARMNRSF